MDRMPNPSTSGLLWNRKDWTGSPMGDRSLSATNRQDPKADGRLFQANQVHRHLARWTWLAYREALKSRGSGAKICLRSKDVCQSNTHLGTMRRDIEGPQPPYSDLNHKRIRPRIGNRNRCHSASLFFPKHRVHEIQYFINGVILLETCNVAYGRCISTVYDSVQRAIFWVNFIAVHPKFRPLGFFGTEFWIKKRKQRKRQSEFWPQNQTISILIAPEETKRLSNKSRETGKI